VTLFEMASAVHSFGGYEADLLKGCLRNEAGPIPPRAGDVSLNTEKLKSHFSAWNPRPWPCPFSQSESERGDKKNDEGSDGRKNENGMDREPIKPIDRSNETGLAKVEQCLYGYDYGKDPFHPLTLMEEILGDFIPPHIVTTRPIN
jgi:hypothetical protein